MCFTNRPPPMMKRCMTECSYAFAGFPATSSRSLFLNLVMKTRMKGLWGEERPIW